MATNPNPTQLAATHPRVTTVDQATGIIIRSGRTTVPADRIREAQAFLLNHGVRETEPCVDCGGAGTVELTIGEDHQMWDCPRCRSLGRCRPARNRAHVDMPQSVTDDRFARTAYYR